MVTPFGLVCLALHRNRRAVGLPLFDVTSCMQFRPACSFLGLSRLQQLTKKIAAELKLTATFEHVTEMQEIMAYQVMSTPALVIDEVVKAAGRMPSREEIAGWLQGG